MSETQSSILTYAIRCENDATTYYWASAENGKEAVIREFEQQRKKRVLTLNGASRGQYCKD